MAIRVAVVDRRRLVREGLAATLATESDIEVVAALAMPAERPDATVDAYLWGEVRGSAPSDGRVIHLSDDETPAELLMRLHDGIELEVDGDGSTPARPVLTRRESEVIGALAEGLATSEIGRALGIATKSVDNHKQRAYAKLGVHSAAQAVAAVAGTAR